MELEKKLECCQGEACSKCGALEFRVERSEQITMIGNLHKLFMNCKECGFEERGDTNQDMAEKFTRFLKATIPCGQESALTDRSVLFYRLNRAFSTI